MIANVPVSTIEVDDLAIQLRDVLRRVQEDGDVIDIADHGKVLARLTPPPVKAATRQAIRERRRALAEEIGKHWPADVSAAQAVAEGRRDL